MSRILSKVPGHEGLCDHTWLNRNQVDRRVYGCTTGFFRLVRKRFGIWWKTGEEFHGQLDWQDGQAYVISTKKDETTDTLNHCHDMLADMAGVSPELITLQGENAALRAALRGFMEAVDEPPNSNCSCHISPPCHDCVDYGALREAFANARAALGD